MIICSQKMSSLEDAELKITTTEFGYIVEQPGTDYRFEFDVRLVTDRPDMMFLNRDSWGKPAFTWLSETANCRDGYTSSRIRKRIMFDTNRCFAVIAIDASGQFHIYAMRRTFFVNNDEVVEVGYELGEGLHPGMSSSEIVAHYVPSMSRFAEHCRAKQLANGRISETDSLAALECQVDLLTKALSSVVASLPAESRPMWWSDVESALTPFSTCKADADVPAALAVALEQKEKVRTIQAEYYSKLAEIYGNV